MPNPSLGRMRPAHPSRRAENELPSFRGVAAGDRHVGAEHRRISTVPPDRQVREPHLAQRGLQLPKDLQFWQIRAQRDLVLERFFVEVGQSGWRPWPGIAQYYAAEPLRDRR